MRIFLLSLLAFGVSASLSAAPNMASESFADDDLAPLAGLSSMDIFFGQEISQAMPFFSNESWFTDVIADCYGNLEEKCFLPVKEGFNANIDGTEYVTYLTFMDFALQQIYLASRVRNDQAGCWQKMRSLVDKFSIRTGKKAVEYFFQ